MLGLDIQTKQLFYEKKKLWTVYEKEKCHEKCMIDDCFLLQTIQIFPKLIISAICIILNRSVLTIFVVRLL